MAEYRYILDKSSQKFICPNCGNKRFVKFIDTTTGNYLSDEYGRCDREQNCGYYKAPPKAKTYYLINFLSIKDITDKAVKAVDEDAVIHFVPKSQIYEQKQNNLWLSEWYLKKENINFNNCQSKEITEDSLAYTNIKAKPQPEVKSSYHSLELLNELYYKNAIKDNFIKFLDTVFKPDQVERAMQDYFITGTNLKWKMSTIFWQIDEKERIRCGKIMLYDPDTGKRKKKPFNHINWLHSAKGLKDFQLDQCLFGLHLINWHLEKDVAIVESEKTAVILSIVMPEYIWLATGGQGNLKLEKLRSLKNKRIILYPDKGEFESWKKIADQAKENDFKISTSDILENSNLESGEDLADYYLKTMKTKPITKKLKK